MKHKITHTVRSLTLGAILVALTSMPIAPAFATGAATPPPGGGGGTIAPQPCDPRYWETMSARAWMEAEREIMQNQNLIFKPDSVMEYTCFDLMVSHGAKYLGDIFVHTGYFGRIIIPRGSQPHAQEVALQAVVYDAMVKYLNDNFANPFLAGRSPELRKKPDPTKRGYTPASSMTPYGNCKVMAEVWKAAKCMNFVDRKNYIPDEDPNSEPFVKSDAFKPFITLKPHGRGEQVKGYDKFPDIRHWPEKCDNLNEGAWEKKDAVSSNKNDQKYDFHEPLKKDYNDVRKLVEPGQCQGSGIETGVTIILTGSGGTGKKDKVCTNPGCTLVGETCQ